MDIGLKYWEKQEWNLDNATMNAGQCVIRLQMGINEWAGQLGMTAYSTRQHLCDPKSHTLPPMDCSTISPQMGTNKGAGQVGMMAPGARWHICDTKLRTYKCGNFSMSLHMGYTQDVNQNGQVSSLGWQIHDPKSCPQGTVADTAPLCAGNCLGPGWFLNIFLIYYYQEEAGY